MKFDVQFFLIEFDVVQLEHVKIDDERLHRLTLLISVEERVMLEPKFSGLKFIEPEFTSLTCHMLQVGLKIVCFLIVVTHTYCASLILNHMHNLVRIKMISFR